MVAPGIGCNLFSVMTEAKTNIGILFTYENPSLEGFDVTVPPRSKSSDLYSLVLDLSADGYNAKELERNPVANAQMWLRRLSHLHALSLVILRNRDCTGMIFEGALLDCDVYATRKAIKIAHPKTATHKLVCLSSCIAGS